MPFPDFFAQFGLFYEYDFVTPEFCQQIRSEMEGAPIFEGKIWNPHHGEFTNTHAKKRKETQSLSAETVSLVTEKLTSLIPQIESTFDVKLKGVQMPKFTRYDEGDYYGRHVDVVINQDAPPELLERKISVIVFLSQEGEEPNEGDYCGGNLTFYGFINDPQWHGVGLPLESEQGLLICFRPNTLHEVTPVTHGSRYTITTWYI